LQPIDEISEKIRQKRILSRDEVAAITMVRQLEFSSIEVKSKFSNDVNDILELVENGNV
jgi:hypothetical protein